MESQNRRHALTGKISNLIRENKTLFVLVLLGCSYLYFAEVRPAMIKKDCYAIALKMEQIDPSNQYSVSNAQSFWVPDYNSCLKSRGL